MEFCTGTLAGRRVVLARSGCGTEAAADFERCLQQAAANSAKLTLGILELLARPSR